jgi:hypothetical protein
MLFRFRIKLGRDVATQNPHKNKAHQQKKGLVPSHIFIFVLQVRSVPTTSIHIITAIIYISQKEMRQNALILLGLALGAEAAPHMMKASKNPRTMKNDKARVAKHLRTLLVRLDEFIYL